MSKIYAIFTDPTPGMEDVPGNCIWGPSTSPPWGNDWKRRDQWPVGLRDDLPEGWRPTVSKPLSQAKIEKIAEINAECELKIVSGVYSSALGELHKYDSDIVDQLNFLQAYKMAELSGQPILYRIWDTNDITKSWYQHTKEQFDQVLQDGAIVKATLLLRCSQLKDLINNCTTVEEVEVINWDTNV